MDGILSAVCFLFIASGHFESELRDSEMRSSLEVKRWLFMKEHVVRGWRSNRRSRRWMKKGHPVYSAAYHCEAQDRRDQRSCP